MGRPNDSAAGKLGIPGPAGPPSLFRPARHLMRPAIARRMDLRFVAFVGWTCWSVAFSDGLGSPSYASGATDLEVHPTLRGRRTWKSILRFGGDGLGSPSDASAAMDLEVRPTLAGRLIAQARVKPAVGLRLPFQRRPAYRLLGPKGVDRSPASVSRKTPAPLDG
jgi:hypothetical protein